MSTRHSLTETALTYWRNYTFVGLGTVTLFGLLSIPTMVIVWMAYPVAKPLFVLAVLSLGLHTGAVLIRDLQRGDYESGENTEFVRNHAVVAVGTLLLYVVPLTLIASVGGVYLGQMADSSFLGLVVALYYPVADNELLRRGIGTPSAVPVLVLFALLHTIGLCRNISPQQVIQSFRRPPMPRMH